jgi:hypothetical protein
MAECKYRTLADLQSDFVQTQGKPFEYFFCPILLVDEETKLCEGHVVNKDFGNDRVDERRDVDGFYGRVFESALIDLVRASEKPLMDQIFNPGPSRFLKPRLFVDGVNWPIYLRPAQMSIEQIPSHHTLFQVRRPDGAFVDFIIKKKGVTDGR